MLISGKNLGILSAFFYCQQVQQTKKKTEEKKTYLERIHLLGCIMLHHIHFSCHTMPNDFDFFVVVPDLGIRTIMYQSLSVFFGKTGGGREKDDERTQNVSYERKKVACRNNKKTPVFASVVKRFASTFKHSLESHLMPRFSLSRRG